MPVHDAAETVGPAIRSILAQTVRDLELIVVDDGSTDGSSDVVRSIADDRLRYISIEKQTGGANAANIGLGEARAPFVARFDADDLALPSRLEHQLHALRGPQAPMILGSGAFELRDGGTIGRVLAPLRSPAGVRWTALFSAPFLHPTTVFDRRRFEALGLSFDRTLGESEDYDLWTRALDHGTGSNLAKPLVLYRLHPGQASQVRREVQEEVQRRVSFRTVRAWLPRLSMTEAEWEPVWRLAAAKGRTTEEAVFGLLEAATVFLEGNELEGAREVRGAVSRLVARNLGQIGSTRYRAALLRSALRVDRASLGGAPGGAVRRARARRQRRRAHEWLEAAR